VLCRIALAPTNWRRFLLRSYTQVGLITDAVNNQLPLNDCTNCPRNVEEIYKIIDNNNRYLIVTDTVRYKEMVTDCLANGLMD